MKPTSHLFTLLVVSTFLALSTPSITLADERAEHKELAADSGGTLTLNVAVGSIDIRTHDKDTVTYDAELERTRSLFSFGSAALDDLVFEYESSGSDAKITMKWKNGKAPRNSNIKARHTVMVPSRYNVDVRTAGGKIHGENINGKVAANTSGGSIEFGEVNGEIKARTSGGSIKLEDINGNADIKTSGGSIRIGNVQGDLLARTSGGSVNVGSVSGELKAVTSGGSINAELAGQISKPLELRTSGGSIRLTVPPDFKANLNARTSGGKVHCDLPVTGITKRTDIEGEINGGGPQVTLKTSGGNITVSKR